MAYLEIRPDVFRERLRQSDYEIYRDGFCLLIKCDKFRRGFILNYPDIRAMLIAMEYPCSQKYIETILTDDLWNSPSDEQIIAYCISQAIIPHPYEEYKF